MARLFTIRQPLDLETTLYMRQAFRWRRIGGWHSGVLGEYLVHLRQVSGGLEYRVGSEDGERQDMDLDRCLSDYFRLDDDLTAIHSRLGQHPAVAEAIGMYPGLRLLRQEPWECLVSYLCSGTNSIGGIRGSVERIAGLSRRPVRLDGEERYVFPGPAEVAGKGERALADLSLGLSSKARNIFLMGIYLSRDPLLWELRGDSRIAAAEAVRLLDSYRGIGPKTASCVALMSLDRLDAFPVDRWVRRALVHFDLSSMPAALADIVNGRKALTEPQQYRVAEWARDHFGEYAGYANQYLFHWVKPRKDRSVRNGVQPICRPGPAWAARP